MSNEGEPVTQRIKKESASADVRSAAGFVEFAARNGSVDAIVKEQITNAVEKALGMGVSEDEILEAIHGGSEKERRNPTRI